MSALSLFPAALSRGLDPVAAQAIEDRLAPFIAAGALGQLEAQVVARLAVLSGELEPDALLAFAFAVRAPAHGHVCVDLEVLHADEVLPEPGAAASPSPAVEAALKAAWPASGAAWVAQAQAATGLLRQAPGPAAAADPPTTPFVWEGGRLYMDRWWRHQRQLALALSARAAAPDLALADGSGLRAGLDQLFRPPAGKAEPPGPNRQRLAAAIAALRPFTVISGGPGMGKTWTVRNVLALLWLDHRASGSPLPLTVALAAPTGKAAARMRDSLRAGLDADFLGRVEALAGAEAADGLRRFLLGLEPRTLHRLLGYRPDQPTRFRKGLRSPLGEDIVVVDEASMVDLALMRRMVEAVRPQARLVLLGDRNQLASVEAGTVLADLCGPVSPGELALPGALRERCEQDLGLVLGDDVKELADSPLRGSVVQLTRTFRFKADSGIGAFASACLARPFDATAAVQVLEDPAWPDVVRMPGISGDDGLPPQLAAQVLEGFRPAMDLLAGGYQVGRDGCVAVFQRRVLDALDRFRVLCAHRRGRSGVAGLNRAIEGLLMRRFGFLRRDSALGRPVLVLENAYAVGRFNGDVGLGMTRSGRLDGSPPVIVFPGPDLLPEGLSGADLAAKVAAGELALVETLDPARLPAHEPVYAMTIHKSQGSEFRHAVVVLPERPSPVLTRELIYTGVTRGKERVTVVGDPEVLQAALSREVRRASGLMDLLWPGGAA